MIKLTAFLPGSYGIFTVQRMKELTAISVPINNEETYTKIEVKTINDFLKLFGEGPYKVIVEYEIRKDIEKPKILSVKTL